MIIIRLSLFKGHRFIVYLGFFCTISLPEYLAGNYFFKRYLATTSEDQVTRR